MAYLNAQYAFDISLFNLNWFVKYYDSDFLLEDLFNPWQDTYIVNTTQNDSLYLYGSEFGESSGGGLVTGTVEAASEWFWNTNIGEFVQAYSLTGLMAPANDVWAAAQTETRADDKGLLTEMLSGNDFFNMSAFDDNMRGYGGNDEIRGFDGDDVLKGDMGADKLFGGNDDDLLVGGMGKDLLVGGSGEDVLRGGTGKDKLFGEGGKDVLIGGAHDDLLRGGGGYDKLFGGGGQDCFLFKTGDDKDIIKDFQTAYLFHDKIDLSGLDSVTGWWDLQTNHMEQVGNNVVIDGGDGDKLVLVHTQVGNLFEAYFDF